MICPFILSFVYDQQDTYAIFPIYTFPGTADAVLLLQILALFVPLSESLFNNLKSSC